VDLQYRGLPTLCLSAFLANDNMAFNKSFVMSSTSWSITWEQHSLDSVVSQRDIHSIINTNIHSTTWSALLTLYATPAGSKASGFSRQLRSDRLAYDGGGMPAPASSGSSWRQQFAKRPKEEYKRPSEQAAEQEKKTHHC